MGSVQHIKNKFGSGYEVEIKVKLIEELQALRKIQKIEEYETTRITNLT